MEREPVDTLTYLVAADRCPGRSVWTGHGTCASCLFVHPASLGATRSDLTRQLHALQFMISVLMAPNISPESSY